MRTHKVGTLTLGVGLILFGVLFLVHLFTGALSYELIFHLWPVVFILLGVEVLLSLIPSGRVQFQLSIGSVVLMALMMVFAMVMAGADLSMRCAQWYIGF